jgi:hypothetical protein
VEEKRSEKGSETARALRHGVRVERFSDDQGIKEMLAST